MKNWVVWTISLITMAVLVAICTFLIKISLELFLVVVFVAFIGVGLVILFDKSVKK